MSLSEDRHELIARIARQRGELANAYRDLAKPLQYAETGMRGLAFLRQNPWIFSVLPAGLTAVSALVGIVRGKPAPKRSRGGRWTEEEERAARKAPTTFSGHAVKWGGRGWKLFRLYRKLRKFV